MGRSKENGSHRGDSVRSRVDRSKESSSHRGDSVRSRAGRSKESSSHNRDSVRSRADRCKESSSHNRDSVRSRADRGEENGSHRGDSVRSRVDRSKESSSHSRDSGRSRADRSKEIGSHRRDCVRSRVDRSKESSSHRGDSVRSGADRSKESGSHRGDSVRSRVDRSKESSSHRGDSVRSRADRSKESSSHNRDSIRSRADRSKESSSHNRASVRSRADRGEENGSHRGDSVRSRVDRSKESSSHSRDSGRSRADRSKENGSHRRDRVSSRVDRSKESSSHRGDSVRSRADRSKESSSHRGDSVRSRADRSKESSSHRGDSVRSRADRSKESSPHSRDRVRADRNKEDSSTTRTNKKCQETVQGFKCMYTNADSLINKRSELQARIETYQPDIIAVTEILPKNRGRDIQPAELELEGFDCFKTKLDDRGACIYTKKWLKAVTVDDIIDIEFKESVWCEIGLKDDDNLLIGCIYRSPNSSQKNNDHLLELIRAACNKRNSHLLIMGDFNYSEVDWVSYTSSANEHHGSSKLIDCLQDNFLHQTVRCYTRYREGQQPSLLDLVIVNDDQMVDEVVDQGPLGKSDHVVLTFDLNCYKDQEDDQPARFIYTKGDYNNLRSDLLKVNWTEIESLDANAAWDFFASRVQKAMDSNIPKTKPYRPGGGPKKEKKPLWMCQEALSKVKKKYHAWKRYTNTKQYGDYLNYVKARNEATKEVRRAKRQFEKRLAKEIKNSPKGFWNYVRSKTKVKSGISDLIKDDGEKTQTDEEKADVLNNFFASVFTQEDISHIPDPEPRFDGEPLKDVKFDKEEVLKKLKNLNPSKSPGPDGLHPRVLRDAAEVLADPLTVIFNKSLEEGKVPDGWKIAHVTAIFKKGKRTSPGNYRPVSLTSVICKLMESLLRDQIMNFLNENKLLNDHQHGFRSGRSCVTQLIDVVDTWTGMLEEEGGVDVAYLDFSKAFDSVPHQRLLKKVKVHGLQGNLAKWIGSFLTGRKQRVVVNGKESSWASVVSGIPQGSVLGPILFVIYINDLPDNLKGHAEMFADDTKVYAHIKDPQDGSILQRDLDCLGDWAEKWQLKFNVNKCGVMHYGRQAVPNTYNMRDGASRTNLEVKEEEKDLGVTFDPTLKFSKHVGVVASKANRIVGLVRRTFNFMDSDMFRTLHKALIRPHLEYGNCVWSPMLKQDISKIEKVQRRATKMVPQLYDLPYIVRLEQLNLPTLAYRRLRGDMIQVFKIIHGFSDMDKTKLFKMKDDSVNLRGHGLKIQKQHVHLNIRKNSFTHRVVKHWNMLPRSAVEAPTVNIFKSKVDAFLSTKYNPYAYLAD